MTDATPVQMVVVGAGPAGISMATEAVRAGIPASEIVVLEKGVEHSWAIRKFYPEQKSVTANYKGQDAACHGVLCIGDTSKQGVLSYLSKVIVDHQLDVRYGQSVHAIERQESGELLVRTTDGNFSSRVCVIAIGILGKPNKPSYPVPGALRKKVHFDVTSTELRDRHVLVVGGGDSASEYVQYLHQMGNKVTLSYRQSEFKRMNEINRASLNALQQQGKVTILLDSDIESLVAVEDQVGVNFRHEPAGLPRFDDVVYALGGTTPENFLRSIGIEFDGPNPVVLDGYETSIPGLFLVGDLSAGKKGGSIISAFNSSNEAMKTVCRNHLKCEARSNSAD